MTSFYTRINVRIDMCARSTIVDVELSFFAAVHLLARAQVAHAHVNLLPMSILIHRWSVFYLSARVAIPY